MALTKPQVRAVLDQVLSAETKEPQLSEIASHFFHLAGGPKAVAKLLKDEFDCNKAGGIVRQRILDMILRVTRFANERQANQPDFGLVSDADLQRLLRQAVQCLPGVAVDHAEQEAQATAAPEPAGDGI